MRARNIKPGFFKNEDLVECSFPARLLFPGLWMMADRCGRLEDRPLKIKMEIFPGDNLDINSLLEELCSHGFIIRYRSDNKRFIQITNFEKHQTPHIKEPPSTIPAPDSYHTSTIPAPDSYPENTVPAPPDSLIPDSLIPDSLIPDSLIPDSLIPDSGFRIADSSTSGASCDGKPPSPSHPQQEAPATTPPHKRVKLDLHTYEWHGITQGDLDALKSAYPACCVSTELLRAAEWIKANPHKRKHNWYRFLTNWMRRSQDNGGSGRHQPSTIMQRDGPLDGVLSKSGQATARNMAAILDLERKANERH